MLLVMSATKLDMYVYTETDCNDNKIHHEWGNAI